MKTTHAAVAAFLFALAAVGCQQAASPTTAPPKEKETNVHINTPGVNVDVHGKGGDKDRKVDVDVKGKDR